MTPSVEILEPREAGEREWGREIILIQTPTHMAKLLIRKAGTKGGLQWHVKEESHYLLEGRLLARFLGSSGRLEERILESGDAWRIPPGAIHQEEALTDCQIIEVGDPTVDDRVRVDAQYGQTGGGTLPSMTPNAAAAKLRALACALENRAASCWKWASQIQESGTLEQAS